MKRTPLRRGTSQLKRTPLKAGKVSLKRTPLAKENTKRKVARRARDFGPHGDYIVPTLPCVVCRWPWWERVSDETLVAMMERALAEPERYEHVSEPAHFEHSRGAGGHCESLVPLCGAWAAGHHNEQHTAGILTFSARYPKIDFPALAARLWALSPARYLMEETVSIVPLDGDAGDLILLADFAAYVRDGLLIDYDGFGHPATDTEMDEGVLVKPSTFEPDLLEPRWTHVQWYNR